MSPREGKRLRERGRKFCWFVSASAGRCESVGGYDCAGGLCGNMCCVMPVVSDGLIVFLEGVDSVRGHLFERIDPTHT